MPQELAFIHTLAGLSSERGIIKERGKGVDMADAVDATLGSLLMARRHEGSSFMASDDDGMGWKRVLVCPEMPPLEVAHGQRLW